MMAEVDVQTPLRDQRRYSLTLELEDGINFQRFCAIMGVEVENASSESDPFNMSPIVIPQLRCVLSTGGPSR